MSEVLGTALLVAVTALAAGAFAWTLRDGVTPPDDFRATVVTSLGAGPDARWGTGDERVSLAHRGGDPLPREHTRVVLSAATELQRWAPPPASQGFADGSLSVGESWSVTTTIPAAPSLTATVAVDGGGLSRVVAATTIGTG